MNHSVLTTILPPTSKYNPPPLGAREVFGAGGGAGGDDPVWLQYLGSSDGGGRAGG